jgi:lysophospholipase
VNRPVAAAERVGRIRPVGAVFGAWTAPDGWRFRRMDWPQPRRAGARGSLLFAGGRGDFIEKYLESYADWHAAGWNVTAFDWRGQGLSRGDAPPGGVHDFDPLIDDLAALIADWRGATPGPHVAVGHSMGGHLLLRTLIEKKPALDAAVLVAPMIRVNSAPFPEAVAPSIADTMCWLGWRDLPVWKSPPAANRPGGARQHFLTRSRERYADELWWWKQQPDLNIGGVSWGWLRAAFRSSAVFTPERLAEVEPPVLLIGTERDRLVSAAAIREAAAHLPRAELEMFKDARHEILRETDRIRRAALARIDAFFAKHAP